MSKMISFGWLTILAATGFFAFHFWIQHMERSKKDWPTANAFIQSSEIIKTKQASLNTSLTSTAPNRDAHYQETDVWAIKINYSFPVNGETILGDTASSINHVAEVQPGEQTPSADIVALADQLRAGTHTIAHYDPANPSENYLIYMESPSNQTLFIIASVLLGIGILLIVVPTLLKKS